MESEYGLKNFIEKVLLRMFVFGCILVMILVSILCVNAVCNRKHLPVLQNTASEKMDDDIRFIKEMKRLGYKCRITWEK